MKRKELRKLLAHFLKLNQSLVAGGQKQLTALQAKLHYLSIISQLPSYGAKCFNTSIGVSTEVAVWLTGWSTGLGGDWRGLIQQFLSVFLSVYRTVRCS